MRRVLRKVVNKNLSIFTKLERIDQEQYLCYMIHNQLIKLEKFWNQLELQGNPHDIEPQLQDIVFGNVSIHQARERLTAIHPLTSQR